MAGNHSAVKVHIDHVVKKFNGRNGEMVALNGVDMDIHENEFICVVGPSGCGKSTLLNIIGGLETPTEGKVLVDGAEVTGPGPDRGIVFQQYALFPWLTVEKNVQFGLKLQGKSKEALKDGVPYHGDKGQIRPGMWKFKNLTGDDNVIDENDKTVIGNAQPKFYG